MALISIIVPTLNEANAIKNTLLPLQPLRVARQIEIIIVDGGSSDNTLTIATPLSDQQLTCATGRALQMNAGAAQATTDTLLFLHADTLLTINNLHVLLQVITDIQKEHYWGRFDVAIDGDHAMFSVIAFMMNWRSHLSAIVTGDQAIFISKHLFQSVNGFPAIPLMEDITISKQLKQKVRPIRIKEKVITSSRRWQKQGVFKTIWFMWCLRFAYYRGASAEQLAKRYYPQHFK